MGKLNLAILDGDARYMENFAGYVAGHYRHRFNVFTFSNAALFIEFVQRKGARADILLIAAEECGGWLSKLEAGLVILLTGGSAAVDGYNDAFVAGAGPEGAGHMSHECLSRYCGADKLINSILRIYESGDRAPVDADTVNGGRENKIIAIFSAEGGSGKTSIAISLCSHFAKLNLRTLYLNLGFTGAEAAVFQAGAAQAAAAQVVTAHANPRQTVATQAAATQAVTAPQAVAAPHTGAAHTATKQAVAAPHTATKQTVAAPHTGADAGLSDIIYTMKARPERLGIKLEALGKSAPGYGFFYYAPPMYQMDIDEIQPSDIELLIARLRGVGIYDRTVVDTSNGLSLRNKALMELADQIFIVGRGGASFNKLTLFKGQIDKAFAEQAADLYKRSHIILNAARVKSDVAYSEGAQSAESAYIGEAAYAPPVNGAGADVGAGARNTNLPAADAFESEAGLSLAVDGLVYAFSAKASVLPYCPDICNEYDPGLLAGISNGFGAAVAEIAHRA